MLPTELILHLISFLPFDSLFNFRLTCREHKSLVEESVSEGLLIRNLRNLLLKYFPKYSEIEKYINSNNIITGSVIVTSLLPEIPFNDIDILCTESGNEFGAIRWHNYQPVNILVDYLHKNCSDYEYNDSYVHNNVNGFSGSINYIFNNIDKNTKQIQISYVHINPKKVIDNFDMDIIQNYYDGKKLVIKNVIPFITKSINYYNIPYTIIERKRYRILKYQKRGFKFNDNMANKILYFNSYLDLDSLTKLYIINDKARFQKKIEDEQVIV